MEWLMHQDINKHSLLPVIPLMARPRDDLVKDNKFQDRAELGIMMGLIPTNSSWYCRSYN